MSHRKKPTDFPPTSALKMLPATISCADFHRALAATGVSGIGSQMSPLAAGQKIPTTNVQRQKQRYVCIYQSIHLLFYSSI